MLAFQPNTPSDRPSQYNSDLVSIYALWPQDTSERSVMKSSDHLAVRKAAKAVDRLTHALSAHLTTEGVKHQRSLPEIGPTTRVRHTPKRFWLEFKFAGLDDDWNEQTVLFAEIRRDSVTIGLRIPLEGLQSSPISRQEREFLRFYSKLPDQSETGWYSAQLTAPAEQSQCPRNLNDWLGQRFEAESGATKSITVCRKISVARPSFEDLAAELAGVSVQFGLPTSANTSSKIAYMH